MAIPVAVITPSSGAAIPFSSLPVATFTLDATASTWGDGTSVGATYQWYLLDAPPGHGATLTNDTTATVTVNNMDLPGSYRLFLVIENSLGDSSVASPIPAQSGTTPFAFAVPPASAFHSIQVQTAYASLVKPAYGDRQWLADSLWPVFDLVDTHEMVVDDFWVSSGVVRANVIGERTAAVGVTVDSVLLKDGDVKVGTSADRVYTNILEAGSVAGGSLDLTVWANTATLSGNVFLGGTLRADTVEPYTTNRGVVVAGRGTHSYDLQAAVVEATTLNTNTITGITYTPTGIAIGPDIISASGALKGKLGGASSTIVYRVPGVLTSRKIDATTTGTTREQLGTAIGVPANTLLTTGQVLRIRVGVDWTASANNNTFEIEFGGQVVLTRASKATAGYVFSVDIVAWSTTTAQRAMTNLFDSMTSHTVDTSALRNIEFFGTTPDAAGTLHAVFATVEVLSV